MNYIFRCFTNNSDDNESSVPMDVTNKNDLFDANINKDNRTISATSLVKLKQCSSEITTSKYKNLYFKN